MAHNLLRITGLTRDVTNPYDPTNIDTDAPLGMQGVSGDFVNKGAVASLLPGETSSHYLTHDCHKTIKECNVDGDAYECVSCKSLGGGTCIKASAELKAKFDMTLDGVCVPLNDRAGGDFGEPNPFTTVEEAYLQLEDNSDEKSRIFSSGGSGGVAYLTKKRGCINSSLVRKNPDSINKNPKLEPILSCTDIVMCGGPNVGLPLHPITRDPITTVENIDFEINNMASQMSCFCEPGYVEDRNPITLVPFCKRAEGGIRKEEGGCPVVFLSGDRKGCLCDDSTQVRLTDLADIELWDDTTDYGKSYIEEARNLMTITERYDSMTPFTTTKDACLPKPGIDPRMASMGYSYATSLFGLAPEITAFNGGHLMTGGLLRESAMDSEGKWHSRIEDNEEGKVVLSESLGGVVPYAGTGSVSAHVWNGDRLNDNNLVGAGGGTFTRNPNASMRVVPLPHSSLPGFGIDSMDHSVAIIASQGKVYPSCVYMRKGDPRHPNEDRRGAASTDSETSFWKDSSKPGFDFYENSPLSLLRSTHDSGICATAYVIPSIHRLEKEKPDAKNDKIANKILPLMHYRPLAKRAAHTPLETIFRHSILSAKSCCAKQFSTLPIVKDNYDTLIQLLIDYHFPNLNGEGKERTGGICARAVFNEANNEELKEIGGLIVQPTTVVGDGLSSTLARFGEKILATNSPKIIDHYKVGSSAAKFKIDQTETRHLYATPPTAWRIVSNEGNFFSGRGLNNGAEGAGMREAEKYANKFQSDKKPDIFSAVVMSGDGVLMLGESAPLLRPMEIPACSLPESTWFERRAPVNERGSTNISSNLLDINNVYSSITAGEIVAQLNANSGMENEFNTYSPAKPYYSASPYHQYDLTPQIALAATGLLSVNLQLTTDLIKIIRDVVQNESEITGVYSPMQKMVPIKFHFADFFWQQCKVTANDRPSFIPPPMVLFESLLRVRTLSSETFVRPELVPNRFRADWGMSPHTAGHYMNGIYSPPCIKEETGQSYGYPCSGALSQYATVMVPKPLGENSHSSHTKQSLKNYIDTQTLKIPSNIGAVLPCNNEHPGEKNIFDKLGDLSQEEKCNCTTGLFCPNLHKGGRSISAPIAAVPSRGNRHSRFAMMTTTPKNDIHLLTALLRAQSGDTEILDIVGKIRQNGKTYSLKEATNQPWGLNVKAPLAPNRWSAFRSNIAYTPHSSRLSRPMAATLKRPSAMDFDRTAENMDEIASAHLIKKDEYLRDDDDADETLSNIEILNIIKKSSMPGANGARARRILDFLESSQGATASTFSVGSFAPHAEGVKDIVAIYATPAYTAASTPAAIINEGGSQTSQNDGRASVKRKIVEEEDIESSKTQFSMFDVSNPEYIDTVPLYEASKNTPRVMRRVHVMPINTPYHGGFECGQTAAQAANTRGVEISYVDFMKPPLASTTASTSLEGVRVKAPEPFDNLATRDFFTLDSHSLKKFAHHHHYGYEGLMSRGYNVRNRRVKVAEGRLKNRFPFVCQSDRGPFPPKRDGTIQPLALVEMGVLPESAVGRTIIQE